MPIAREGRFLLNHDPYLGGTRLGLESSMLEACIQEVQSRNYLGVFGSPSVGFNETSLDALEQLPHLRHVWFWDIHLKNIDGLYALQQLESFGIHPRRPPSRSNDCHHCGKWCGNTVRAIRAWKLCR